MKETAKLLKESREQKNVSLNEVSAATKINIKVLEALENADLRSLPSKTFLRGFVQTYAKYLKLDVNSVLDNFQKEMGLTRYEPVINKETEAEGKLEGQPKDQAMEAANNRTSPLSRIFWAGIVVALIFGIYIISEVVNKYQRETVSPKTESEVNADQSPTPATTASTTPTSSTAVVGAAVPSSASGAATKTFTHNLMIEALDVVTIGFRTDNGAFTKVVLQPEQKYNIQADKIITADVSDGGAIILVYNTKEIGVPGDLGKPIKLRYP